MPSRHVVRSLMLLASVLVFTGCGSPSTGVNKVAINNPEACCRNLYCTSTEDSQVPPQFLRDCESISAFICGDHFYWSFTDCQALHNNMMTNRQRRLHIQAVEFCQSHNLYGGPC